MKKIAMLIAALDCTCGVSFGQGQLFFNNHVFSTQTGAQASVEAPILGVGGVRNIMGTGWSIALWAAPSGSAASALSLVPGTTSTFRTSSAGAGYILAGITASIPGVGAGQTGSFQVRAWNNEGGTVTTWEQAVAAGREYGASPVLNLAFPLGGGTQVPPNMVGLQGFTLIPEPASTTYAFVSCLALLSLRRRK